MKARRKSFIGMDPALTDPPAASEVQQPVPPAPEAKPDDPQLETVQQTAPQPEKPKAEPRKVSLSRSPADAAGKHAVNVRVHLGTDTTTRLEAVAQQTGRDLQQLVGYMRKSVAADFRAVLAEKQPPPDAKSPSDGMTDRMHLVLSDDEYATAQILFDPLGFGDHAMRDGMRPVLARLYREWTLKIAKR